MSLGKLSMTAALLMVAGPVAAAESSPQPWAIRIESGVASTTDHLHQTGEVGVPPPLYLGVAVERRIVPRLYLEGVAGAALLVGPLASVMARFRLIERPHLLISAGAGPTVIDISSVGLGAFAGGDLSAEIPFESGVETVVGIGAAFAVNRSGSQRCGGDTCEPYLARGDQVITAHLAVGYTF